MDFLVPQYAALLAFSEVAFGSVLHAFQIPLAGHALSLNQGVLLTLASRHDGSAARRAWHISLIAAILKALSPAGKRLTPMLAISVQGTLYAGGVAVLGRNQLGVALGMALLSLWGFLQPVLVAYLLFGKALFVGMQKVWLDVAAALSLPPELEWWILGGVVVAKAALAVSLGILAFGAAGFETRYREKVEEWGERFPRPVAPTSELPGSWPKVWLVVRDLTSSWFLLAMAFNVFFFFYSGERNAEAVWTFVLRPLAFGALFFWAMRSVPRSFWEKLATRFPTVAETFRRL